MIPIVSVVIPAYNAEKYIDATISSVLKQTFQEWEIIIVDDGSKDQTANFAKKHLNNQKIKYYYQSNQGVSAARNNGISRASGQYIAFLDADDYWLPENLEEKIQLFTNDLTIGWVFSDMYESDFKLENLKPAPIGRDDNLLKNLLLWEGEVVPGPSSNLVVKRECFSPKIVFDTKISTAADLDFCIQLASKYKGLYLPKRTWIYRQLNQSMSRNIKVMEYDCLYIYLKASKNKLFGTIAFENKCFSNMYLILAGSWWVSGNKYRGCHFIIRSILAYPPIFMKLLRKLFS